MSKEIGSTQHVEVLKHTNTKPYTLGGYVLKCITYILLAFAFTQAYSSEMNPDVPVSAKNTLQRALSLFNNNQYEKSNELANQALLLAQGNNNLKTKAQTHVLLAELASKEKNISKGIEHYRQAAQTYAIMQSDIDQIRYLNEYVILLLKNKNDELADSAVNDLIGSIDKKKSDFFNGMVLSMKAQVYFAQKHFKEAEEEYKKALSVLTAPDEMTQKKRGAVFRKIAEIHKRLKNREETAFFYKEALAIFTSLNDIKNMARTLKTLAEAERYLGNYEKALDYSRRSLDIHQRTGDKEGQAKALMGAGIIYRHIERYENSLKSIHQAYLVYTDIDDEIGIAKTSNEMGLLYSKLKEFNQARSFFQHTIDLQESQIEPKTLATAFREMAVIDLNSLQYESAKIMAMKAHDIYKKENELEKGSLTARVLANAYRGLGDNENAVLYYKESLALAGQIGSKIYQMKAQIPLASMLRHTDVDEAMRLLEKALQISIEIGHTYHQLDAYTQLRETEKWRGNFEASLAYAEKEIYLTQAIQEENEKNQLILERAKLYSHKKEVELETLKHKVQLDQVALEQQAFETAMAEQARKISELNLTKNKYASVALASLLAICLIAALYIYRRFIDSNKRNKELDYLAARDSLTNCYNRRILFDFMTRYFADPERTKEYCIILADIDHFKSINDNYGHSKGDSVLCAAANVLQKNVRENDIVARFGGEEFCIILPNTSIEQAVEIAESLRHNIEHHSFEQISLTCSFGISSAQFNTETPKELIDQADKALFKSKSNGRNLVTLWEPKLNDSDKP
ncbi:diguanylate cyclase [Marinomonas sp. C2222]|uniref:diguanylate cyclase n=1 Tax=Marinomonas sargassi TaxID=2984494 RepID=A0ABT2YQW1_9GAMM|nr:diguanylate cyclase [Marinomonas sargassi]MCV2402281.1 diguanylate cyclase [Marinomonas sargassi]